MQAHDLTQTVKSGMPVYPHDPEVSVEEHATMPEDGYRVMRLDCGSHTGTHVDAPSHTESDGATIDEFPVDRFALDAAVADCRGLDSRSPIGPDHLPVTDADVLVVRTGWDAHWGDAIYRNHPYLTPAAADFCLEQGYDVAVDALNPDPTPTPSAAPDEPAGFPVHHTLLGNDHLIFENLTNLEAVPDRFELLAFPLKVGAGDGAPVRAVARYE
ncbi:cyclase family protein [Halomicroarcula sp. F13]|uniref:Cyclase family protein n=1 Tax=Haloarcula rubra TaxID=2487747 RepID=A0AAW4PZL4_9EURY|nr:cyclase family protein [Halomicroarcula rubra]MBX0326030.1 cyclase family protein [Halomicroarcula rubra]